MPLTSDLITALRDFEIDEALKEMGLTREQALNDTKV